MNKHMSDAGKGLMISLNLIEGVSLLPIRIGSKNLNCPDVCRALYSQNGTT